MYRTARAVALATFALMAAAQAPPQPAAQHRPRAQVDVDIFYESLAPHGEWVEMQDYGWSWAPRVERGWRPYTRGQWVLTDYGWFWDSDEDFGWAAYHYGRWVNDRYYGWVWVPGTEWAPAWVSWRRGNGYTGWAPLPPSAVWRTHGGLTIGGLDLDAFIGQRDYAFVSDRVFVDRGIYRQVLPPTQNVNIINVTANVTNYTTVDQRIVDRGLDAATYERALGRRVPRMRTVDVDRAQAPRAVRADELAVFRPEVRAAPERRPRGRSLLSGEAPPPLLLERRKEREQERRQRGDGPDASAKDVARRRGPSRPASGPPPAPTADRSAQEQRARQADADQRRATQQNHERLDRETRQENDQRQREQALQGASGQPQASDRQEQGLEREQRRAGDQQRRGQAGQAAADPPTQDQLQRKQRQAEQPQAKQGEGASVAADRQRVKGKNRTKKQPEPSPNPSPAEQKQ